MYGDNVWGELEDFGDSVSGKRLVRSSGRTSSAPSAARARATPGPPPASGTDEYLVVLRGADAA